jgi:hypothetical protein
MKQFSKLKNIVNLSFLEIYRLNIPEQVFIEKMKELAIDHYYEGTIDENEIILKRVGIIFKHGINDNVKIRISIQPINEDEIVRIEYRFPLAMDVAYEFLRLLLVSIFLISIYNNWDLINFGYGLLILITVLTIIHLFSLSLLNVFKEQFLSLLREKFKKWELQRITAYNNS